MATGKTGLHTHLKQLHQRFGLAQPAYEWAYNGLSRRTPDLTSRVESGKIKDAPGELGKGLSLHDDAERRIQVEDGIDLVLASNMLSVGIDIGRLNLMLMSGQRRIHPGKQPRCPRIAWPGAGAA